MVKKPSFAKKAAKGKKRDRTAFNFGANASRKKRRGGFGGGS